MSPSEYRRKRGERSSSRVPAPAGGPPPLPVLGPRATRRSSRPPEDRRRARGSAGVAAATPPPAPAARIRGRVRLTRAGEATPPARGAEWRGGEAGAPPERL